MKNSVIGSSDYLYRSFIETDPGYMRELQWASLMPNPFSGNGKRLTYSKCVREQKHMQTIMKYNRPNWEAIKTYDETLAQAYVPIHVARGVRANLIWRFIGSLGSTQRTNYLSVSISLWQCLRSLSLYMRQRMCRSEISHSGKRKALNENPKILVRQKA